MSCYSEIHHKLHLLKKNLFSEKEYGKIFMLHRVATFEKERLYPNENMKVTPDFLENKIIELKKTGYDFISLDDLYSDYLNGTKRKKIAIFTIDDGYSDIYYNAFPIFNKYSIPFTIYITTGFQEKKCFLWWYVLEDLLLENDFIKTGDGQVFDVASKKNKEEVFMQLRDDIAVADASGNTTKEIELTAALEAVRSRSGMIGLRLKGCRYDMGNPTALVETVVEYSKKL